MAKYRVRGWLGGGFGGCESVDWEEVVCKNESQAMNIAWQNAVEAYETYEGSNGLRTVDDILEEEDVDIDEANSIYFDERESWLDYECEEITDED